MTRLYDVQSRVFAANSGAGACGRRRENICCISNRRQFTISTDAFGRGLFAHSLPPSVMVWSSSAGHQAVLFWAAQPRHERGANHTRDVAMMGADRQLCSDEADPPIKIPTLGRNWVHRVRSNLYPPDLVAILICDDLRFEASTSEEISCRARCFAPRRSLEHVILLGQMRSPINVQTEISEAILLV